MSNIKVLIDEKTLLQKIDEIAAQINEKYAGEAVKIIGILKGSVFFVTELAKRITTDVYLDFMQVSSYGEETVSSGDVVITKDLEDSIEGQHIILVEDIVDTGYTLNKLMPMLMDRNPASLELCVLLSKPSRRMADVTIDYCGFEIEDKFVVGFGMDAAQKYRNLPYIGYIEE
ncbi:MAG: hypoxanthine phosphoribosyltransferase [Lachnospiraceae bacterium]